MASHVKTVITRPQKEAPGAGRMSAAWTPPREHTSRLCQEHPSAEPRALATPGVFWVCRAGRVQARNAHRNRARSQISPPPKLVADEFCTRLVPAPISNVKCRIKCLRQAFARCSEAVWRLLICTLRFELHRTPPEISRRKGRGPTSYWFLVPCSWKSKTELDQFNKIK